MMSDKIKNNVYSIKIWTISLFFLIYKLKLKYNKYITLLLILYNSSNLKYLILTLQTFCSCWIKMSYDI